MFHFRLFRAIALLLFPCTVLLPGTTWSQTNDKQAPPADDSAYVDYDQRETYTLAGIVIDSDGNIDPNLIAAFTGLKTGRELQVPGDALSQAIRNLWKQKLFSDVSIRVDSINGRDLYLEIKVTSLPRVASYDIRGTKKSARSKIIDKAKIEKGDVLTRQYTQDIKNVIHKYYREKGYNKAEISLETKPDTAFNRNSRRLIITIDRGSKTKIQDIEIVGNEVFSDRKLETTMKKTRDRGLLNLFKSSKFRPDQYPKDKSRILTKYREAGYRDVAIVEDSIYFVKPDRVAIRLKIDEGNRYHFRNINWSGNTKYSSDFLGSILGIEKGDVYNPARLQKNLFANPRGLDISSLYLDNGYLFFSVDPVETRVEGDSVDLEIRIREGKQATIDEVTVTGNKKTNDHVVLRELRTRPGQKFSRSDIIRSQRELAQLGFFAPEQMNVVPTPDPANGTVDLEYQVVEKETDQIELSGGFGQGRFIGQLALSFNNFSTRKLFDKSAWRPLPSGDGQKLSFRVQSNTFFSSYNVSFTEPWFGGHKPNSLSVSAYHSRQGGRNGTSLNISGVTVGLGKRLQWPDDFFTLYNSISYKLYALNGFNAGDAFPNDSGRFNSLNIEHRFSRNSISQPIFPQSGSKFELSFTWTPPLSIFESEESPEDGNGDPGARQQFSDNWLEYHKTKFNAEWYLSLIGKLVLTPQIEYGFLGRFQSSEPITAFERFYVGGDGLTGFSLDGRELVRLRGYANNSLTPNLRDSQNPNRLVERGGTIYQKYTLEMRYPISLNPNATLYVLSFLEGGNTFLRFDNFNPFFNYRSVGVGARVFLPMFGMLGMDYGYGLDRVGSLNGNIPRSLDANGGQFHISIGQQF